VNVTSTVAISDAFFGFGRRYFSDFLAAMA
jgi:hypothetical protein